jgi:hypothetical protein
MLDCHIDGIAHIICRSITVDKPRFVPKETVRYHKNGRR